MLVQQILSGKPEGVVVTVPPGTSVAEAVEILSARRIGALIVSTDGRHVAGILSERDVVRELGRRGPACLNDPVEKLMTTAIIGCSTDESTESVMQKMTDGRFRHMPVMQGAVMVGLISIGDVVKARLSELAMEKDALEGMIKGF
ncbi:MAG: CBS domain-containing protein [Rhodobacteraceae bacterium]|nr:CBS domain-containing protein [Paracoccaceae bacterium]